MASKPNPSKPNRHALYLAASGFGKTTLLKQNPNMSKPRAAIWDPGYDHDAPRVRNMRDFVAAWIRNPRQRLAVTLDRPTPKAFELFCKAIWHTLSGEWDTLIVVEEIAGVQLTSGKAGTEWGTLIRESRKFGGIILGTSQRAQEIDKTILTQANSLYVGCHSPRDARVIGREIDVDSAAIQALTLGQFYLKTLGPKPAELIGAPPRTTPPKKKPVKKPAAKRKPRKKPR